MLSTILIIDKRKELSVKYKKALDDEQTLTVVAKTLKDALNKIQDSEPDLIIISDSIEEPLTEFCERIRALTYNTRPVIVALSKSADMNDRIKTLECGADDFWSEPVDINEFKIRIKAHLRRELESNLDNKTLLPNNKLTIKSLKRILNTDTDNAVLLIGIDNLENYKSMYSDIAGDKLIQALIAIIKSAAETNDFLGQIDSDNFILITNTYKAEKFAAYLVFAFDTIVSKFYSETDAKRGYMLIKGDRQAGMRANFVSLQIGGILGDYDLIKTPNALLERLYTLRKTAKIPSGSNYIIDRAKLTGGKSQYEETTNGKIYISEPDEALSLLIRTTLELQGYDIAEKINLDDAIQPTLIIMDGGDNLEDIDLCKNFKNDTKFANTKIIVTSSVHNKTKVLDSGADLYIPKPYELSDLIRWVEYLIKH